MVDDAVRFLTDKFHLSRYRVWSDRNVKQCIQADVLYNGRTTLDFIRFLNQRCPPYRGVHVIRDPMDVLVSGYAWHYFKRDSIPGTDAWPEVLQRLSVAEGLQVEASAILNSTLRQ
eukprot:1758794-Amphidinium_carterae.1